MSPSLLPVAKPKLGLHQISEIVPVKGAVLVGPLPKEIQNTTTYAAGLSANAQNKEAAQALIKAFSGPAAAAALKSKGMESGELRTHAFGSQMRAHSIAALSLPRWASRKSWPGEPRSIFRQFLPNRLSRKPAGRSASLSAAPRSAF